MPGKPSKREIGCIAYDYHECRDYLQATFDYDERDYAGTFKGSPDAPYLDFWHWVLARAPGITNGCCFVMEEGWKAFAEPWQEEILNRYLDAFGEGEIGNRTIEFYVWW